MLLRINPSANDKFNECKIRLNNMFYDTRVIKGAAVNKGKVSSSTMMTNYILSFDFDRPKLHHLHHGMICTIKSLAIFY